ncbi:MAG: FISUMP domain-containing protein [Bacteroidales bacterium]|nr:FISUMP domain-containing protein [Bacteroidales bacterium]
MKYIFGILLFLWTSIIVVSAQTTVTDIDGNVYNTVTIGTQTWMAQNLRTTTYNDGTAIPNITDQYAWTNLSQGAYCWYNNSTSQNVIYGALYNWMAVETGQLCPVGWHVPTDVEWITLQNYVLQLGNPSLGLMLKSNSLWYSNSNGNDVLGFAAYPTGWRNGYHENVGYFYGRSFYAVFWSSTIAQNNKVFCKSFYFNESDFNEYFFNQKAGFSVRCLQDSTK